MANKVIVNDKKLNNKPNNNRAPQPGRPAAAQNQKPKGMKMKTRRNLEGLVFVLPWIIGAALFFVYPLIQSIRYSFSNVVLAGTKLTWIGLDNYKYVLSDTTDYIEAFGKQAYNTPLNTVITLVFSLIIAMLINRDMKGRGFFRTVFFIPVLLGTGYVMEQLLGIGVGNAITSSSDSMLTEILMKSIGGEFAGYVTTFLSTITVILWKSGVQIILFLAGLQGISASLYEASRVDGATEWENFWKITLPLISPIILLNIIYTLIDSFTDTQNEIMKIIEKDFENGSLAWGAAKGWLYFLFTFVLCLLVLLIMKKLTFNQGER